MASYSTSEFKGGLKVMLDGDPCNILENENVKPGKGQAFSRTRLKNLKTGRVLEKTFKSNDTLEAADVVDRDMQYLYNDGEYWHFMEPDTFDQHQANKVTVGDAALWMKEEDQCIVTLFNGEPLVVTPPNHVVLEVVDTDPGLRGDTATGGTKLAKLSTGAAIKVPLFMNIGDIVRVDTRTGEYLGRAKE